MDAKTIWLFRESLVRAGAIDNLFARFDKHLSRSGYLAPLGGASLACRAMKGGQIVPSRHLLRNCLPGKGRHDHPGSETAQQPG